MKRMMLIGKTGVGKTSLIQALKKEDIKYKKTQSLEFYDGLIDTPGEYIENKKYYNALITMSFESDIIALVHDSEKDESYFSPGFANMFNIKVIGIITKVDSDKSNMKKSKECLELAGVKEIYSVSALNGSGIEEIEKLLS
jgi:ethanolamine utilization protein EutP